MCHFSRIRAKNSQRGQALLIAVLAMTALIGMVAMTIDVGMLFHDRRHYQNSADAMALAGVAELPTNPALAIQKARDWGTNNGISASKVKKVEVRTTGYPNDTLYVELEGQFSWMFGRVLGMNTSNVGADAAARIGTLAGGHNMMPWALLQGDSACLDAQGHAIFGMSCAVKVGAQNPIANGWRGALDFDGNGGGANEYRDNIVDGTTDWSYCIAGQDPPPCHSVVDALQGNKVGPTDQGIQDRLAQGAKCDENGNGKDDFNEVFKPTGQVSPAYSVNCGDSPWLIIIPIVSFSSTPVHEVTIRGWTLGYLENYGCFSGTVANITESSFVSARPMPGGAAVPDPAAAATTESKPCDHDKAEVQPAVERAAPPADEFVMAVDPGSELPASLRAPQAPAACHNGQPHGQQQCATPTPTPSPVPTATRTPTPTPSSTSAATPTSTAAPTPTATPTFFPTPTVAPTPTSSPVQSSDCKNGKGHWQVSIKIADAAYSQNAGFLGNFDPTSGVLIRRLIQ